MNPTLGDNKQAEDELSRLLTRAASGDEPAFAEMVKVMENRMRAFFRKWGFSVCDAEDATQDVFLDIFKSLAAYDPKRPAGPWMWTIAWRIACDLFRRSKASLTISGCGDVCETVPAECDVRSEVYWKEMLECISRLPRMDYQVLERAVRGFSSDEIAAVIGLSHACVRQRLSRIRKKLAMWLVADGKQHRHPSDVNGTKIGHFIIPTFAEHSGRGRSFRTVANANYPIVTAMARSADCKMGQFTA
jgi:RNA polymerase sigma factor (sigma-70 family)